MTAHDLARLLLDGPDLRVLVSGYEWGLEDVSCNSIHRMSVKLNVSSTSYGGPHEVCEWNKNPDTEALIIYADRSKLLED